MYVIRNVITVSPISLVVICTTSTFTIHPRKKPAMVQPLPANAKNFARERSIPAAAKPPACVGSQQPLDPSPFFCPLGPQRTRQSRTRSTSRRGRSRTMQPHSRHFVSQHPFRGSIVLLLSTRVDKVQPFWTLVRVTLGDSIHDPTR
jgi:hypothetical protein